MPHISDYLKRIEVNGKERYVAVEKPVENRYCLPDCPICGGLVWVRNDVPVSHPEFGKLVPCPNANLFNIYGDRLGIPEDERGLSWGNIDPRDDANVTLAVQTVKEYLDRGHGWVFLYGPYGLAKTLILKIAAAEMIRKNRLSAYARMADVIEDVRKAYDEKDHAQEEAARRLDFWSSMPVLCLDEFDRLRSTPFESEKKFVLLDRRYDDAIRGNTVTLIASNTRPEDFDGYLSSRIRDGRFAVVTMTGKDFRPQMTWSDGLSR